MIDPLPRTSAADGWQVSVAEAAAADVPPGARSVPVMRHGTMTVRYYAPKGVDRQTPHDQDEVYVVATGSGWFVNDGRRARFAAGDVLFTPAGAEHRFEDFTEDFGVWVVFYGPRGGEAAGAAD
ncbi:MAG: cupin domain-containing protein [Alphaproteobacteria bacterium]|jgi:mannose-6-phosphate isomerase-like protein (cupin superfamily)|nr:cupin domain-containing protein [Alphaproteobacteria bacterium]MDP6517567.1 cupin domain-containing protein [Alphaproteobacteria bacterium]